MGEHVKAPKNKERAKMSEKKYTAEEIIERIREGWTTEEELKALYEFIENAEMESEEELEKLRDSGYANLVYDSYAP